MDPVIIPCGVAPFSYRIHVSEYALTQLALDASPGGCFGCTRSTSVVVLTDRNVWGLHGASLTAVFAAQSIPLLVKVIPPGEAAKTRVTKEVIEDWMLANGCLRDSLLVAFGGGVVGDLGGFVAATYMRGIRVAQVPTTLLAMVDSAIGGKTGLDVPAGKNLVGAFLAPVGVYAMPSLLRTLPVRELSNGMAEIIKAGAIASAELFEQCENSADAILAGDPSALGVVIAGAARVKAGVVTEDEREGGRRAILNWGHTIGHGIEARLTPGMLHGEAVAIGMVKEAEVARALGLAPSALVNRVKRVLAAFKLPTAVPAAVAGGDGLADVLGYMSVDKKNVRGEAGAAVRVSIVPAIGTTLGPPFTRPVPVKLVRRILARELILSPHAAPPPFSLGPLPHGQLSGGARLLRVPGSKSISNRALLLAGLARGTTHIQGLLASDDTQVMLTCLSAVGARVRHGADGAVIIEGTGGVFSLPPRSSDARGGFESLFIANAGTASRFLASVVPLLPLSQLGSGETIVLTGNARMGVRPIGALVDALREQGVRVEYGGKQGCPPLLFSGGISLSKDSKGEETPICVAGAPPPLRRRVVKLAAKLSSQYVSSILLAAPFFPAVVTTTERAAAEVELAALDENDPTRGSAAYIELLLAEDSPTSLPYITMTLDVMAGFGVRVLRLAANRYLIPRHGTAQDGYEACESYDVEPDASSASYPAALAAVTGRTVVLEGIGAKSVQGDAAFPLTLQSMGASVERAERDDVWGKMCTVVGGAPNGLRAIDVNLADQTDCFMTLATVAALAEGTTRITGIAK